MRRFTVTASTVGQASTAQAERKNYKFKRDPTWVPNDPRYQEDDSPRREGTPPMSPGRARRLREFAGLLDEGKSTAEAAELLGVALSTAREYERETRGPRKAAS